MKSKVLIAAILMLLGVTGYYASFYFRKTVVNEELPRREERVAADSPQAKEEVKAQPAPAIPKLLKEGSFQEVDFIHKGSGVAKLVETDRGYFVRFEDFKVTNGPDLFVYLVRDKDIVKDGEFVNLGRLKGSEGNQNYQVKKEDIDEYSVVIIWCRQFSVLFSHAKLM